MEKHCRRSYQRRRKKTVRTLTNEDDNGGENFTQKQDSHCFKFHRSYSKSSSLSQVGDFFQELNSKGQYLTSTKKIDCEQSLFFFRFSESNPRARERRSRETRETRAAAISHARGYLRISRFARSLQRKRKSFSCAPVLHIGGVTRDDSQRRFLAKNNVATLLLHCFEWLQHCYNIVPTLQRCVVLKIVVANRLVQTAPGLQPIAFLPSSLPSPSSLCKLSCTKRTKTWSLQITIIFQQISVARGE